MLLDYYKLSEQPFGVTPDPRFLYLGAQHREALASLEYTTESNRGFVALIAKPGMGKTSVLFHFLERLRHRARTAFVFRTDCNAREFMRHVLLDLGIDLPIDDLPAMHDALNRVLTEEKRGQRLPFVLVIDEAQNLSESVLESIRLLSNFETPWMKLMQIVLAGQPQLEDHLAKPSMVQVRQRIAQIIRIEPFNAEEVSDYMDRRLEASGCRDLSLFSLGARGAIAHYSEGIPRNINTICFSAMSLACAMKLTTIDRKVVVEAMSDLALGAATHSEALFPERAESTMASVSRVRTPYTRGNMFARWAPRFAATMALTMIFFFGVQVSLNEPRSGSLPEQLEKTPETADSVRSFLPQPAAPSGLFDPKPPVTPSLMAEFSNQPIQAEVEGYNGGFLNQIQNPSPWLSNPIRISARQVAPSPSSTGSANKLPRGATRDNASLLPKQAQ